MNMNIKEPKQVTARLRTAMWGLFTVSMLICCSALFLNGRVQGVVGSVGMVGVITVITVDKLKTGGL